MLEKSPLAPSTMPTVLPINGARWASFGAKLRYQDRDDLALIAFDETAAVAAVFTQSSTAGHPIVWNRRHIAQGRARAILINSGNANVFRGCEGDEAVQMSAEALAELLSCEASEIFVASTGVIGERLPVDKLCAALPQLVAKLDDDQAMSAANSIMTTDTFPKWASRETMISGRSVKLTGIAKGSGMIAPDMATMLAFIATDAAIEPTILQTLVKDGADQSFNCITVDSDTSTSDTLMVCATGKAGNANISSVEHPDLQPFRLALNEVMTELAMMVVRDGEGARKLISIFVEGAQTDLSARNIGRAVANSPLVKTAIAGEDANWGRVIMAIGKSGEVIDLDQIGITFGGQAVAAGGQAVPDRDERFVDDHLKGQEISIDIKVGVGPGSATVWTCDLTHAYIDINADYRS